MLEFASKLVLFKVEDVLFVFVVDETFAVSKMLVLFALFVLSTFPVEFVVVLFVVPLTFVAFESKMFTFANGFDEALAFVESVVFLLLFTP